MSLNKAMLIGRLGSDPELKYTPSGVAVCTFRIATNEVWTDKDGNRQEKTEWHNIKIWRRQAEIAAEFLEKGKQVYIEGRIETRNWEQDGQKRYMTEIVADKFRMLDKKPSSEGESKSRPQAESPSDEGDEGQTMQDNGDLPF